MLTKKTFMFVGVAGAFIGVVLFLLSMFTLFYHFGTCKSPAAGVASNVEDCLHTAAGCEHQSAHDNERSEQLVKQINARDYGWKARVNPSATYPETRKKRDSELEKTIAQKAKTLAYVLANWLDDDFIQRSKEHMNSLLTINKTNLPPHYDMRKQWPFCPTVHQSTNQGACGSCWASSFATAMSDRICIHSGSTERVEISSQDLIECCDACDGCHGSMSAILPALNFAKKGLVTGGAYGSSEGCKPYIFHTSCGSPCSLATYASAQQMLDGCQEHCRTGYTRRSYAQDKYFGTASVDFHLPRIVSKCDLPYFLGYPNYFINFELLKSAQKSLANGSIGENMDVYSPYVKALRGTPAEEVLHEKSAPLLDYSPEQMETIFQLELLSNGPFPVCFEVYAELQHYAYGVFHHTPHNGGMLYTHCVKLIGWGEEHYDVLEPEVVDNLKLKSTYVERKGGGYTLPYWIVANSWGADFGENGFFRIARGPGFKLQIFSDTVTNLPKLHANVDRS